jgi:NAD-dependent deacetylase
VNSAPDRRPCSGELRKLLTTAGRIVVFTGAGISAESGVPTFRGEEGLWKRFKPEELANVDAFLKNPDLVWQWYCHRRDVIASVRPNPGHAAIAAMDDRYASCVVITQNIDNLHRRAGSRTVHELHGNIERNYCLSCGARPTPEEIKGLTAAPRCAKCGGLVRPDVVWFGELLPEEVWNASVRAAEAAEIFFSVGTSSVVYPAASLPQIARRAGAYLVEVNIERTDLSPMADEVLLGKSGEILPALLSYVEH